MIISESASSLGAWKQQECGWDCAHINYLGFREEAQIHWGNKWRVERPWERNQAGGPPQSNGNITTKVCLGAQSSTWGTRSCHGRDLAYHKLGCPRLEREKVENFSTSSWGSQGQTKRDTRVGLAWMVSLAPTSSPSTVAVCTVFASQHSQVTGGHQSSKGI